ncbi:MAG: energy transducer TonB [Candidatus Kapabacteria bacterium]|nr:energy transducer TonB [Ignavibacteriota bacterium]MCW5884467.1 energy transducer TonB [Candidatus Kapabacteria bacterium]
MSKSANIAVEIPTPSGYGAVELKAWIEKNTYKGFIITASIVILLLLAYYFISKSQEAARNAVPLMAPIVKLSLENLPPQDAEALEAAPPPQMIYETGPASRAGTPIAVPDAQISADMKEFAKMDELSRASSVGGDGIDLGGFAGNIDLDRNARVEIKKQVEEEPDIDAFIAVEKDPQVDLAKLQKSIVYPDMARRAGIEGRVIVRVLVGADGKVRRSVIEDSDNVMLNDAAIKAVNDYGLFTPAIQNGQPITCWVSIPITFRLR